MKTTSSHAALKTGIILALILVCTGSLLAQATPTFASYKITSMNTYALEPAPTAAVAPAVPAPIALVRVPEPSFSHPFWDRTNCALFATTVALSSVDFYATRSNLQHGGRELNPVTRVFSGSTAGLAVNFSGQAVGVVGISYLFHKTGHHKLERMTSLANIGSSSFAVAYSLSHR
jgi:hypothetical protein